MTQSICLLILLFTSSALAETSVLSTVEVQDSAEADASFLGFTENLKSVPISVKNISAEQITTNNITRLTDVTRVEASLTESYSGAGYWDSVSLRGYILDPRTSYLRDGLPISGETAIALENKESIQVLKGFGGIASGANVPGGLVNYQTKKANKNPHRQIVTSFNDEGGFKLHGDVNANLNRDVHVRVNLAQEYLRPKIYDTRGERSLAAFSILWQQRQDVIVESELEWSRQSQPTQAGFSLLGTALPEVPSRINLNNQPWTQPVEFTGLTGSVKVTKAFSNNESLFVHAGVQDLQTNDRLAYPFGCSAEGNYDRFCSDGTFDVYDYRSEGERRKRHVVKAAYQNLWDHSSWQHSFELGAQSVQVDETANMQSYNLVGQGNINGTILLPENPAVLDQGTLRKYQTSEVYLSNQLSWQEWKAWTSLRQTWLHKESKRTNGTRATDYDQQILTPWFALSYEADIAITYLSYTEGTESFVTPNRNTYTNAGTYLSDVRSRQWELGTRARELPISAAIFSIERALVYDAAPIYQVDGKAVHQGLELQGEHTLGAFQGSLSLMYLNAKQQERSLAANNGERPVNVPGISARAQIRYFILPEMFSVGSLWAYEGDRTVLADGRLKIPAWNRFDVFSSFKSKWVGRAYQVQLRVDNIFDSKYWKESPTQYGHIYLYPSMPRQTWLQVQVEI